MTSKIDDIKKMIVDLQTAQHNVEQCQGAETYMKLKIQKKLEIQVDQTTDQVISYLKIELADTIMRGE